MWRARSLSTSTDGGGLCVKCVWGGTPECNLFCSQCSHTTTTTSPSLLISVSVTRLGVALTVKTDWSLPQLLQESVRVVVLGASEGSRRRSVRQGDWCVPVRSKQKMRPLSHHRQHRATVCHTHRRTCEEDTECTLRARVGSAPVKSARPGYAVVQLHVATFRVRRQNERRREQRVITLTCPHIPTSCAPLPQATTEKAKRTQHDRTKHRRGRAPSVEN